MSNQDSFQNETGAIAIIFAVAFSILILFIAFTTDLALAYSKKAELQEVAHLIRDARFALIDETWNAEDPEWMLLKLGQDILKENGYNPDFLDIKWREGPEVCYELCIETGGRHCQYVPGNYWHPGARTYFDPYYQTYRRLYQDHYYGRRCAKVWIEVSSLYETRFLKMIGISKIPIKASIEGHQIDSRKNNRMWRPGGHSIYVER